MSSRLVAVTCPSCGLSKSVPFDQCPPDATVTNCPKCKTTFVFSRDAASLQAPPPLEQAAPPKAAGTTEASAPRQCPKCGYERKESDAVFDAASCPKCHVVYAKCTAPEVSAAAAKISGIVRPVNAGTLIYHREHTLFTIHAVVALIYWVGLVFVTKGAFLFALPALLVALLVGQSALIAHLKGNGIKLSPTQFPDLYDRHVRCCKALGLADYPDAYLINGSGFLNAFATRFLGRNFVVLFSNTIQAMSDRPDAINFYIGHELGHIKQKHLQWAPFIWPVSLLPLVGAAYSRAREYTCDQFGRACCDSTESALKGLIALSAGEKLWSEVNIDAYLEQTAHSSGFWMSLHELISDYPWLVKRAARINNPFVAPPPRSLFAWIFALFMPRMGVGGSAAGVLVTVAIIGILAAIAVPQFAAYKAKAQNAQMRSMQMNVPPLGKMAPRQP
ncbi:M48 family metalloprotease [Geomonas sp. Red69]|uniref:M48 family metalloprotease n=1 Tax=Geomonas diazotrophica TaxID=2843197 RepID=UPI001C0FF67A|nr:MULTISPECIES: M48 family metalloprotease [Geomonas]MBU5636211.1 M48 family metalloprotease [Geomonas diazotrophica]QXE85173.1 M48 family metalloprotease [Geomonas nitrogeniifigens]